MNEEEIFHQALARSPEERPAFLERACSGDPALRASVEALLRANVGATGFLEQPAPILRSPLAREGPGVRRLPDTVKEQPAREGLGTIIGPYKLLQPIGEGGMGSVFMAEQTQPVQRKVALKIIKPGMDSRSVITRFEAERQALALMDHPNIARVIDAGTTDSGRLYFAMELVKGIPITRYCDEHQLTPKQRLELFVPICHAIQHAHQKGIIHRDLKPSNVLVAEYDDRPVPKVIDFGVAKATGPKLTERTMFTEFGAVVGTLEYMSPEQAKLNALDIDTRSDIYALGVLLYELLTGTIPFEKQRLQQAAFDEILRIIREEEPPRPSTRVSTLGQAAATVSAQRRSDPRKLSQLFRGELDWIVMKCLEKDRNRRYETANGLARDIERYLTDEPVQACPPSAWYRFRKFARRNKTRLAIAALVLFFVVVLAAVVGWVLRDRATRQAILRERGVQALAGVESSYESGKLPEALAGVKQVEGLLAGRESDEESEQRVRQWRKGLETAARLEEIRLECSAVTRAGEHDYQGTDEKYDKAFKAYGLDVTALAPAEAAARIRASVIKPHLVAALDDWVRMKGAARLPGWQHLLAIARHADPDPFRNRVRDALPRTDRKVLEELARAKQLVSQPPAIVLLLEGVLERTGRPSLRLEMLRRVQARRPNDYWINNHLGVRLMQADPPRRDEAIGFFRAALALRPQSPGVYANLGKLFLDQGNVAEAEAALEEALRLKPDYAAPHLNLAIIFLGRGELAAAERHLHLAGQYAQPRSSLLPGIYTTLAALRSRQDRLSEAQEALQKAIDLDPDLVQGHLGLGFLMRKLERYGEALKAYRRAHELVAKKNIPVNLIFSDLIGRESKYWRAKLAREVLARMVQETEHLVVMENNRKKFQKGQLPGGRIIEGKLTRNDATDPIREGRYCKVHTVELEAGKLYRIDLVSPDFQTFLRLENAQKKPLGTTDKARPLHHSAMMFMFVTRRSAQYRLIATTEEAGETGRYYLGIQELAPAGKPMVVAGTLTPMTPLVGGCHYQVHPLKGQAGHCHVIDLQSPDLAPCLLLKDAKGNVIARDNTSGTKQSARLFAPHGETQRLDVVVRSCQPGRTGRYTLRMQKYAEPGEDHDRK
jgi:tetratricopeptide (TPR) repeat protein